ncbi:MAG: hypothetical protein ACI4T9_12480 [Prevotella sp.]
MKKTYQAPAVKVKNMETNSILAASNPTGASINGDAPTNATGLAKKSFFFEDDAQPSSSDWLNGDEQ